MIPTCSRLCSFIFFYSLFTLYLVAHVHVNLTYIKMLQTVQNLACRIVSGRRKYDHVSPALKELRWLPVKEHLYYRDAVMSFKCLTGCAPGYLSTQFIRWGDVTNRRTRSSQMLNIPRFRTASGHSTFFYRAVTLWNSLSNDLKLCESVNVFKRRLRSRLLSNFSTSVMSLLYFRFDI